MKSFKKLMVAVVDCHDIPKCLVKWPKRTEPHYFKNILTQ